MITLETKTLVTGITCREIFDFLASPSDREYQRWWPGVHLQLHTVSRADGHVGDVVFMNEYVGGRRVRLSGVVVEAAPAKRLVWQLQRGIRLPVWLSLDLAETADGVMITHRIRAGWAGWPRVFDAFFRLYFSRAFASAMNAHVRTEFRLLRDLLRSAPRAKPWIDSAAMGAPAKGPVTRRPLAASAGGRAGRTG